MHGLSLKLTKKLAAGAYYAPQTPPPIVGLRCMLPHCLRHSRRDYTVSQKNM